MNKVCVFQVQFQRFLTSHPEFEQLYIALKKPDQKAKWDQDETEEPLIQSRDTIVTPKASSESTISERRQKPNLDQNCMLASLTSAEDSAAKISNDQGSDSNSLISRASQKFKETGQVTEQMDQLTVGTSKTKKDSSSDEIKVPLNITYDEMLQLMKKSSKTEESVNLTEYLIKTGKVRFWNYFQN